MVGRFRDSHKEGVACGVPALEAAAALASMNRK
jgi:hypothetical protein